MSTEQALRDAIAAMGEWDHGGAQTGDSALKWDRCRFDSSDRPPRIETRSPVHAVETGRSGGRPICCSRQSHVRRPTPPDCASPTASNYPIAIILKSLRLGGVRRVRAGESTSDEPGDSRAAGRPAVVVPRIYTSETRGHGPTGKSTSEKTSRRCCPAAPGAGGREPAAGGQPTRLSSPFAIP
jgi:hypothetical protein